MRSTEPDALTVAMANRIFDTVAAGDLGNVDVTVRALMEDRFLARDIGPRLDKALAMARVMQSLSAGQGRAAA